MKMQLKKKEFKDLNTKCNLCDKKLTESNSKKKAILIPGNKRICDKCYDDQEYLL